MSLPSPFTLVFLGVCWGVGGPFHLWALVLIPRAQKKYFGDNFGLFLPNFIYLRTLHAAIESH